MNVEFHNSEMSIVSYLDRSIDHVVLSEDLAAESVGMISNFHDGRKLSDHFGVMAELSV